MGFLIYRISDKKIIKRFTDIYEAENFLRDRSYSKKADFTGGFYPSKSFDERDLAVGSSNEILTAKRQGFEYVTKHGHETYVLPPVSRVGILQRILNLWRR